VRRLNSHSEYQYKEATSGILYYAIRACLARIWRTRIMVPTQKAVGNRGLTPPPSRC
jgi:hypothetical protein